MLTKVDTLVSLLYKNYKDSPDKEWLFSYINGQYKGESYRQVLHDVIAMSLALQKMGITKDDQVALFSYNNREWVIMDFALMLLGAISVPFYHGLIGDELNRYMELVDIKMVCVNTIDQYSLIKHLPAEKQVSGPIMMFDDQELIDDSDVCFSTCLKEGRDLFQGSIEDMESSIQSIDEDQIMTLMFSSGTSARRPSPVKLTHKNIVTNIKEIAELVGNDISSKDRSMAFLPMSHILARTGDLYSSLVMKQEIYFIPSMEQLIDYLPKVSPTLLVFVPRVLEKIHDAIYQKASPTAAKLLAFGIDWSTKTLNASGLKKLAMLPLHSVFKHVIYRKILNKIGKNLNFIISGGAPITLKVESFFYAIGIDILAGYGLTETSPVVAVRTRQNNKLGTVGQVLKSYQVSLQDDGEIWLKGPSVTMGYHNDPEAQAGQFSEDGWFKTGDLGCFDENNNLMITGRKKDVIVLSNGKKCIPGKLEELLLSLEEVDQVCLIGDEHSYLVGVIIPSKDYLHELDTHKDETLQDIQKKIDTLLKDYPNFMKVKNVVLSNTPFTYENGLLTYTQKIKRQSVAQQFKSELDKVYSQKRSVYVKNN